MRKIRIFALVLTFVLLLAGCGSGAENSAPVPSPAVSANTDGSIIVSTIDELLSAIAPDTVISLAPGTYNITEAETYGDTDASEYYTWRDCGYGKDFELVIHDCGGLSVIGSAAEIVTEPRSVSVLAFRSCDGLKLSMLSVGHTEAAEACEGGVIRLEGCNDALIDWCSLYGCGTVGVCADGCTGLKVTNCDIHHCSSSAFFIGESQSTLADNCRIYDCGRDGRYEGAASLFYIYDSADTVFTGCEVYNNHAENLVTSYDGDSPSFSALNVHDNHFGSVFTADGEVSLSALNFSRNIVDSRFTSEAGSISLDGKSLDEAALNARYSDQLSSSGVGTVESEYVDIDITGCKEVHVKTADEFIRALASDTLIYIDAAQINLTDASSMPKELDDNCYSPPVFSDKPYSWQAVFDGWALCIGRVDNLHIVGGEIVTEPRYANVLSFYECSGITLDGVYLGHTKEAGSCVGGVLYLDCCGDVILNGCDLYGCGVVGIEAHELTALRVQDSTIHDCSYAAAWFSDSDDVSFLGCTVRDCPSPHFTLSNCTLFSWDGKLMDANSDFDVK